MAQSMTRVTPLAAWSAESVRLADALDAIEELHRSEAIPATRTSVMTLVIVATEQQSASRAVAAIHELGGRHPARVLTLLVEDPDGTAQQNLDAEVRLLGGEAEGHQLWFEEVELRVRGRVVDHLDSLIEPLTLPDLPVVVWFVDGLPERDDALLVAADALLVDARDFGEIDCFATLATLTEVGPVVDLSWMRLLPWRQMLAGLFDGPAFRPFVRGVHHAEVRGRTGPRYLLGGWLTDRLRLPLGSLHIDEGSHVSIRLVAEHNGRQATFEVVRRSDERVVHARAEIKGGAVSTSVVRLPPPTPAWGLAAALSRLERDPLYERALRRAIP
jgi:glucose-6-phosphate dehydrogenase assembly protein OpcA